MTEPTSSDFFTVEDRFGLTIVRFSILARPPGTDLARIQELWSFLDAQVAEPPKVLVIMAPQGLMTTSNLDAFWGLIQGRRSMISVGLEGPKPEREVAAMREESAFVRFVDYLRRLDALVVFVLRGEIDLPFLGPALAGDRRIVAEDTLFVSRCLEVGMPPLGALSWHLSRFLGPGRAADLLIRSRSISAAEAFELGLVDEVVPVSELEDRALQWAGDLASKAAPALVAMKRALIAAQQPLDVYLEDERRIVKRYLGAKAGPHT